jgi:hypothetical protein
LCLNGYFPSDTVLDGCVGGSEARETEWAAEHPFSALETVSIVSYPSCATQVQPVRGIVGDQLARIWKRAPELGEHGLAIAAASVVLRQKLDRNKPGINRRPPDKMT